MVFYMIGLGLGGNVDDITMKGYHILRNVADIIYLEAYTSIFCGYHNHPQDMIYQLEQYYFNNNNNNTDAKTTKNDQNQDNDSSNNGNHSNKVTPRKKQILLADRDCVEL
jgi:hypothetical protein